MSMNDKSRNRTEKEDKLINRAEQRLKIERDQIQFKLDCETLMNNDVFVRYISTVLEKGQLMTSIFTGNSQTYYNSGKQDFAREIWKDLLIANQLEAVKLLVPKGEV